MSPSPLRPLLIAILAVSILASCSDDRSNEPVWTQDEMSIETIKNLMYAPFDCNNNSIADSLDIASHVAADVNRNGLIDECDPDTAVRDSTLSNTWRTNATTRAVPFFRVRHTLGGTVDIDYTVPGDTARVSLRMMGKDGRVVHSFVDGRVPGGAYSIVWRRIDAQNRVIPPGRYAISLSINGRTMTRYTAWAKWPGF